MEGTVAFLMFWSSGSPFTFNSVPRMHEMSGQSVPEVFIISVLISEEKPLSVCIPSQKICIVL